MPRLPAKLGLYPLKIESLDTGVEKSIVKFEVPYRDGAQLADMGAHARTVSFRCYFWDDDYDKHLDFFEYACATLDKTIELLHPAYGAMFGKIESVKVHEDQDWQRKADIDITFVEQKLDLYTAIMPAGNAPASSTEGIMQAGIDAVIAVAENEGAIVLGADSGFASKLLDPAKSLLDNATDLSLDSRAKLAAMDTRINEIESILSSVTIPIDALAAVIEWPDTLSGRVVGAVTRACARIAASLENIKPTPQKYVCNLCDVLDNFVVPLLASQAQDDIPIGKYAATAAALSAGCYAGQAFQDDADLAGAAEAAEAVAAFDALGNYLNPPDLDPFMTINDLERSLAAVRSIIQVAVDANRSEDTAFLRSMAAQLLEHVNTMRIGRLRIVERELEAEMPLHAVLLREGLSYRIADRILAINPQIKNPSFVAGKVLLYAR